MAGGAGFELPRGTRTAQNAPQAPKYNLTTRRARTKGKPLQRNNGGFTSAPLRVPPYQKRVSLPLNERAQNGGDQSGARLARRHVKRLKRGNTDNTTRRGRRNGLAGCHGRLVLLSEDVNRRRKRQHKGREKSRPFPFGKTRGDFSRALKQRKPRENARRESGA